jgi:Asp-tRNA(Asn)/Glu-tRNA(Gln) amidotransferase A subunit family amidase
MFDATYSDPSKIKVGIHKDSASLPVCKATRRAVELARKALVEAGFEVVDVDFTPEELGEALVANLGTMCDLLPAYLGLFEDHALPQTASTAYYGWWLTTSRVTRWAFIKFL